MAKKVKRTNKKRRSRKSGLRGFGLGIPSINTKQIADDGKNVLCMVGGLVLGNIMHNTIDNVITKNGAQPSDGIKKYIAPLATAAIGLAAPHFVKNNDIVKYIGYGIAAAGGIKTVKKAFDKDLLSGSDSIQGLMGEEVEMLPGFGETGAASEIERYEQQVTGAEEEIIAGAEEDFVAGVEEEVAGVEGDDDTLIV